MAKVTKTAFSRPMEGQNSFSRKRPPNRPDRSGSADHRGRETIVLTRLASSAEAPRRGVPSAARRPVRLIAYQFDRAANSSPPSRVSTHVHHPAEMVASPTLLRPDLTRCRVALMTIGYRRQNQAPIRRVPRLAVAIGPLSSPPRAIRSTSWPGRRIRSGHRRAKLVCTNYLSASHATAPCLIVVFLAPRLGNKRRLSSPAERDPQQNSNPLLPVNFFSYETKPCGGERWSRRDPERFGTPSYVFRAPRWSLHTASSIRLVRGATSYLLSSRPQSRY